MVKPLTAKEKEYCRLRIEGLNQTQAYKGAYNTENMKYETIKNKAYQLERKGDIRATLDAMDKQKDDAIIKKAVYDVEECAKDWDRVMQLAESRKNANGDYNPDLTNMAKAIDGKMRLFGLDKNKTEISGSLDIQKIFITPEEHDATLKHIEDVINDKS
jgi:hypothetical protein